MPPFSLHANAFLSLDTDLSNALVSSLETDLQNPRDNFALYPSLRDFAKAKSWQSRCVISVSQSFVIARLANGKSWQSRSFASYVFLKSLAILMRLPRIRI